jgi:hypothetical protein
VLVDFGAQPPSNRFERTDSPPAETHPLVVGQCTACGLIQLIDPMHAMMAKSRFEWLTYNEPEGHLDDLVTRLCRLPGVDRGARIAGLTYKDDSTLARLNKLGYANTYRFDARADFALQDPCAGLESIQAALDAATASRLAARHGSADLLLVRHVLEHAHDPAAFLRAVTALVKPGGYLLFELPDCAKFIQACDYSFIWEEHITYFCAQTLESLIAHAGLCMCQTIIYPYPLEDSLIGVVRNGTSSGVLTHAGKMPDSLRVNGQIFARRYPELRAQLQSLFGAWRRAGKRVAIFGAGHLAAKFVNMFALGQLVDCVIDDNPHKQALVMPGSRLAIRGSPALESRAIDLCLLSLNPESEQKVLAKNKSFLERGGTFLSIFALSTKTVYAATAA